jgi:4-amino-4-deoxy-L-arabinose transferase-like glycosyltransferase
LVGFAFLAKMLQSLLVVPALALAYLIFAPVSVRRRIGHLLLAGLALVVSAGWWVAIVELVPASSRPYIGGSQTNSILELTLGYNGFGRLDGSEVGSVGGGMGHRGMDFGAMGAGGVARRAVDGAMGRGMGPGMGGAWGQSGWSRLFDSENAAFIAWLLPAACILLVAGLWATRKAAPRAQRAAFVLWGGWLVVTALVFSFMQGIFHSYYTVALAPAVGAVVGMGAAALWSRRHSWAARAVLAGTVALTAVWSAVLLGNGGESYAWLRYPVLVVGLGAAGALLLVGSLGRRIATGVAVLAVVSALTAPAAYAVSTAATPHTGAIPSVGSAGMGGPGGHHFGHRGGFFGRNGGSFGPSGPNGPGAFGPGGFAGFAPGGPGGGFGPGGPGAPAIGFGGPGGGTNQGLRGFGGMPVAELGTRGGAMGGLLGAAEPSQKLVDLLKKDSGSFTWVAATVGANNAAGYQLATRAPVMAIGGFNGSDPAPTLAQFQQWVAQGRIHYFLGSGRAMPPGMDLPNGRNNSQEIAEWVTSTFSQTTVDGVIVVDLSTPR